MEKKIIKGWAVVTERGTLCGAWPYHVYSQRGWAELKAAEFTQSSGSKRKAVKCEITIISKAERGQARRVL